MPPDPTQTPSSGPSEGRCDACGSARVARDRVLDAPAEAPPLDVCACRQCGDYWVEDDGSPLTAESMRGLGLIS